MRNLYEQLKEYYNIDIDLNNMDAYDAWEMYQIALKHTELTVNDLLNLGDGNDCE